MRVSIPTKTEEWQAYRRALKGVGASDAPNILGIGFRSPFETWELMTGRAEPESNERMARGHRLEPVARAWAAEKLGKPIRQVRQTVRDPEWPDLFCHPDGIVAGVKPKTLVEIKTAHRDFGDELPQRIAAQVQLQMLLTHAAVTRVAVMTFDELYLHEVPFAPEDAREVATYCSEWYQAYVVADVAPIDGSRAAGRYLDKLGVREVEETATRDQSFLAERIKWMRLRIKETEAQEARCVNELKESMAGGAVLRGDGFRVTWRPYHRREVDHKTLANVYRDALEEAGADPTELDAIASLYTTETEVRPFRLTLEGGSSDD